jgi:putative ABC transport system substrate-binding protein
MRRREFITLLGLAASLPLAARAQKDGMRLVGMLWPSPEQDPRVVKYNAAFLNRLRQLGYIDGKTFQIPWRYAGGVLDRLPGLARELVALKVDAIVAVAGAVHVRGLCAGWRPDVPPRQFQYAISVA